MDVNKRFTSTSFNSYGTDINQSRRNPERLDMLAYAYNKSKKRLETPSEYNLGGGLFLTNTVRPKGLPEFPFGIRFDKATSTSDIKNNTLLTSLTAFEISKLQGMGMEAPRYLAATNGFQIFTLTSQSCDVTTGFISRSGILTYQDMFHRVVIPTFDTVMILIASTTTVPMPLRRKAFRSLTGNVQGSVFRHHKPLIGVVSLLAQHDDLENAVFRDKSDDADIIWSSSNYAPQAGEVPEACVQAMQACTGAIQESFHTKLQRYQEQIASGEEGLAQLLLPPFLKIFTLESYVYSLLGLFLLYALYRLVRDVLLTVNCCLGILLGSFLPSIKISYDKQCNKKLYNFVPQSGVLGSDDGAAFTGTKKPASAKVDAPPKATPGVSIKQGMQMPQQMPQKEVKPPKGFPPKTEQFGSLNGFGAGI